MNDLQEHFPQEVNTGGHLEREKEILLSRTPGGCKEGGLPSSGGSAVSNNVGNHEAQPRVIAHQNQEKKICRHQDRDGYLL